MVRKYEKSRFPNRYSEIHFRLLGSQKNEIIDYAKAQGLSVNQLVLFAVIDFIRNEKGIPSPGSAQFTIPTMEETITAYMRGEDILTPCGKTQCDMELVDVSGMQFCKSCNIRVV
jgi:hypothetical protein